MRASPSLFERTRSPGQRVSPVQSPGLFERARTSPSPSPIRRYSPSPASTYRRQTSQNSTNQIANDDGKADIDELSAHQDSIDNDLRSNQTSPDIKLSDVEDIATEKQTEPKHAESNISNNFTPPRASSPVSSTSRRHKPDRLFSRQRPSDEVKLDRSLDLTASTIQDDRPSSRQSSNSNFSFSHPVSLPAY